MRECDRQRYCEICSLADCCPFSAKCPANRAEAAMPLRYRLRRGRPRKRTTGNLTQARGISGSGDGCNANLVSQ